MAKTSFGHNGCNRPQLVTYLFGPEKLQIIMLISVSCDSLRPSQQFFSHVVMGLPGLNQYY